VIELKKVSFQYDSHQRSNGIVDIDLTIQKGEVVLLCGESGCGKTTLTRLINGLIPHYYNGTLLGEVRIDGKDMCQMDLHEISQHVGSVFQNPRSQFYCMDTCSEMAFACENQGMSVEEIKTRIQRTASELNMEKLMQRNIFHLSGGEKQKIACGCVHTASPNIIVLDEPSSNLDTEGTQILKNIIRHWKGEGKTIIIAEHRLHYLSDLADRMIYMQSGKIEKILSMEDAKKIEGYVFKKLGLRPLNLTKLSMKEKINEDVETKIQLKNYVYSYKKEKVKALNIDVLDIPKGKIVGIVGHNGAGKSTFARCLCGLSKKFKGKIQIESQSYNQKQCVGKTYMVMQDVNHQLFTETVLDEVMLSMKEDDTHRAQQILKSLNLLDLQQLHPMSLSGGQKQRVAIAGAIASEKDIIIFDEPTSGLDLKHMMQVSQNIKQLKTMGKTMIIITHDLEFIMETCDYIAYLKNGEIKDFYKLTKAKLSKLIAHFSVKEAIGT